MMEVESDQNIEKTRTKRNSLINRTNWTSDTSNADKSKKSSFLNAKYPTSFLIHRSNSITIPISEKLISNNDSTYSRSYNCSHSSVPNYGATNNKLFNKDPDVSSEKGDIRKLSTSTSNDSSSKDSSEGGKDIVCFGLTKRQLKVFISLVLLSLNDVMGYSAIAPFFPVVAESKGLSPTSYGLIFSAYSLCGIFSSLLTGTVLVKVGAKFCVIAGMFWNTGAIFCFGFLDKTAPTPFLVLSILSRGLMGFGSNCAFTAMFAIVFQEFSERAITVLSLSEALVGVGGMVAPLIGGGLYDLGGYVTPFMAIGSTQILLLGACWYMLPYVPIQDKIASRPPFYLLTHSSALLSALVVIYIFTVNSFIISNMGPFLTDEFQLSATMIGVVLLVSSIFYAGMSPVWGYITDRWSRSSFLIEVGVVGVGLGMMLAGPAGVLRRLFGWQSQHLWLVYFAAGTMGFFFGGALMPTFNEMIIAATELKLSDTILVQYGLVSGLWNMAFSVGDILGPTVGGLLVERYKFPSSAALFGLIGFVLMLLKLLQRLYRHQTHHKRVQSEEETTPLLGDSEDENPQV